MRCIKAGFVLAVLPLLLLFLPTTGVQAATITATNASETAVAAAIASASAGDTVLIPAGTATWTSTLSVNKNITIQGAGTNSTFLSNNIGGQESPLFALSDSGAAGSERITGIAMSATVTGRGDGVSVGGYHTPKRVDHCMFSNFYSGLNVLDSFGVSDHNSYINCNFMARHEGQMGQQFWATYAPIAFNSTNFFFHENEWATFNNGNGAICDSSDACGYVVRYSTFYFTTGASMWPPFDVHGDNPTVNQAGIVTYLLYNNTLSFASGSDAGYLMDQRGGVGLVFSNTVAGNSGSASVRFREESFEYSWPAPIPPGGPDYVKNTYVWENRLNGNIALPFVYSGASVIQLNQQYFTNAPSQLLLPPYPHPLVTVQNGGSTTNAVISLSCSSLNYGLMAVGSISNQIITVKNTGVGTLTGAVSGVSSPFSVSNGSYILLSGQTQAVTVSYTPTQVGSSSQTVTFTGGGGTNLTLSGTAYVLLGLSFNSTAGMITLPFVTNLDGSISQSVETLDPTQGGEAVYVFSIVNAGSYSVSADVNAPADNANSFFVNIDAEPTLPMMIWNIPATSGWTNGLVTWLGAGLPMNVVWSLNVGTHKLIVRGREAGVSLGHLYILPSPPAPAPPTIVR